MTRNTHVHVHHVPATFPQVSQPQQTRRLDTREERCLDLLASLKRDEMIVATLLRGLEAQPAPMRRTVMRMVNRLAAKTALVSALVSA